MSVDRGEDRADRAGERSRDRRLHLHALDHHERIPGPDRIARRDLDGHHKRRPRSADAAAATPGDDVGHAVHLDDQPWSLTACHDAMAPPEARHDPLVAPEVLNVRVDHAIADLDPVAAAAQAAHVHLVRVAAQAQLHLVPGIGGELRPAAGRGREEGRLDSGLVGVGRLDGSLQQRHGMLRREMLPRRGQPVKPPAVVAARTKLGRPIRVSSKALLVVPPSTTTTDRIRPRCSRLSASRRSRPQAATVAITEPDPAVISSPSPTPASTRIPAPDGGRSAATRPGVAAKARSGSSAARQTSMACPRAGGGLGDSWPPRAMSSCSLARSSPVVSSVTRYPDGDWTLKPVNRNCRVAGSMRTRPTRCRGSPRPSTAGWPRRATPVRWPRQAACRPTRR